MFDAAQPGSGSLCVERVAGRSVVTRAMARAPMKLLVPRPRSRDQRGSVHAVVSSYGGGLVAGDRLALRVELGDDTTALLSSQASTKIYRRDPGPHPGPAMQSLHAALGQGSLLAVMPDPVTPFAHATYEQEQRVAMPASAGLVLLDWFTAGRIERGERWAFAGYRSHTEVIVDGRCVLADGLWLDPVHGPLDGPHRMGRFNCFATALILGEPLRDDAEQVAAGVHREPPPICADFVIAASRIEHGTVLRAAGVSVEAVTHSLRQRLAFVAERLGYDYQRRKY